MDIQWARQPRSGRDPSAQRLKERRAERSPVRTRTQDLRMHFAGDSRKIIFAVVIPRVAAFPPRPCPRVSLTVTPASSRLVSYTLTAGMD
jgi:hypothetical protein